MNSNSSDDKKPGARSGDLASDPTAELDPGSQPKPRPTPLPARFVPGDLVATRYKIVKGLGSGGMGEVYEAQDLLLGESVALKTIKAEVAKDERVVERFKREIQLARKVTHPNVCRIFDVGLHRPDGGGAEVAFLTMELLDGETLSARLHRDGPLPVEIALPLVTQMAAALGAAHQAGVVHRDFKSANVMLVGGTRAVVTDFGLARALDAGSATSSMTGDGSMVGSPAYMAPEQVEGGAITPATDVFSFGVVLYEMVTGVLPFVADSPIATAVKRLRDDAEAPRAHHPTLPLVWNDTILRCLARPPARRPAPVSDVAAALAGAKVATTARLPEPARDLPPARRRRLALLGALAIAALLAGGLSTLRGKQGASGRNRAAGRVARAGDAVDDKDDDQDDHAEPAKPVPPEPVEPPEPPDPDDDPDEAPAHVPAVAMPDVAIGGDAPLPRRPARRSVAVLGFKNLTGRADATWLSGALSDELATELAAGGELRTLPGESVARARRELNLGDEDAFAADTLHKLRQLLNTDYVLIGSYMALGPASGGKLRLDMKLQDTRTGETVATLSETGTEADLVDLVTRSGTELRSHLALAQPTKSEIDGVRAALPAGADVARLYAEGLAQLRDEACSAARLPLEQAIAAEPTFALGHAALSEALACLGYDDRALAEAEEAVKEAANLPAHIRLAAEARMYQQSHHSDKAVQLYAKLFRQFPDNFDYGITLAEMQAHLMRPGDARATLTELRKLPPPAGESPRIDLVEAWLLLLENHTDQAVALATQAQQRAAEHGARLVVADALIIIARAHALRHDAKAAMAALTSARAIFEAANDKAGLASVLSLEAWLKQTSGDAAGVKTLLAEAEAIAHQLGSAKQVLQVRFNVAASMQARGDLSGALAAYDDVAEVAHARKQPAVEALALMMTGTITLVRAELDDTVSRMKRGEALGQTDELGGELRMLHATAVAYQGDLDEAERILRETRDAATGMMHAQSAIQLAWVLNEQGQSAAAEKLVREAIAESQITASRGQLMLARILLTEGRAREALAALPADLPSMFDMRGDHEFELAPITAEARAGFGDAKVVAASLHTLEQLEQRALQDGLTLYALHIRAARARVLLAHGKAPEARQLLESIVVEAHAHGVLLIERQAQALLDKP